MRKRRHAPIWMGIAALTLPAFCPPAQAAPALPNVASSTHAVAAMTAHASDVSGASAAGGLMHALTASAGAAGTAASKAASQPLAMSVTTDKARYQPGDAVKLTVSVTNRTQARVSGVIRIQLEHLMDRVGRVLTGRVSLAGGEHTTVVVTWHPPKTDYQGYLVEGTMQSSAGALLGHANTAVDVSSTWTKFPRYGYVSDYPTMTAKDISKELAALKDYHIDGLQFYDWQWKHDVPLAGSVAHPAASWQDIAGRTNERQTILNMIQLGHQLGMLSFNYNLLYGAWAGYASDGSGVKPSWGLYSDTKAKNQVNIAMPSGWNASAIDVMNPANPAWQKYIFAQEKRVFQAYPFDGWQVDQLGDLGTVFDAKGHYIDLESTLAPFLNKAAGALKKQLIFNDVGGFGLPDTATSAESVAYEECWPSSGQWTYDDLTHAIDTITRLSGGKKAVVLAAYLDSNKANSYSNASPGLFSPAGVLLTDAAIFAGGGDHIELGDNLNLLDAPYFPNHNLVMSGALKGDLLSYYNFMVAYENLLRDGLTSTDATVSLPGKQTSPDGMPQTVWTFAKSGASGEVVHLINLYGQKDNEWQDANGSHAMPPTFHNPEVKIYLAAGQRVPQHVYVASPDWGDQSLQAIHFRVGKDKTGRYVQFTVPELKVWDMVYLH